MGDLHNTIDRHLKWLHYQLPGYRGRQSLRRVLARRASASLRVFVEEYTMVSPSRLAALERGVRAVVREGVPGDVVECGTARGGSAALMALWLKRLDSPKKVFVFDTFEGLPPPTAEDPDFERAVQFTGLCRGELDEVKDLFRRLGVLDRAVFVKGKFQDTLPTFEAPPVALLHLDADWYESTMVCLNHLWDRVSPGGIVQLDDYGSWEGCKKAADEFLAARGVTEAPRYIDRQGRWLRKPRGAGS